MNISVEDIKNYYDQHIHNKLRNYVIGNNRIEQAWHTLVENIKTPIRVLEIGCGIGDISYRMYKKWDNISVFGIDISAKSIEVASKLFQEKGLTFSAIAFGDEDLNQTFDLIVLMDVYEHIKIEDRPVFHAYLKNYLAECGKIFLSCPTIRHQRYLKNFNQNGLQPIDEEVILTDFIKLAEDLDARILLYKEVSVWREGDYCHVIIGRYQDGFQRVNNSVKESQTSTISQIISFLKKLLHGNKIKVETKQKRNALVKNKLGIDFLRINDKP